jgi:hypothetical protein
MTKNHVNAPENLRVQPSKFKSELTFNEWVERYNVSRQYVEPSVLYQGNPSCGINPKIDLYESQFKIGLKNLFMNIIRLFKL